MKTISIGRQLRRRAFGIPVEESSFARRGFHAADEAAREHLERIGRAFLEGYHAALDEGDPERSAPRLEKVESDLRGFAYEGAAMAFTFLDRLPPWGAARLLDFLRGAGGAHAYMIHVGAGWACARLPPWLREAVFVRLDPLLRWLVWDGYGFHEGYFRWPHYMGGCGEGRLPAGYAGRAFTQGLGRSLWFVNGADAAQITTSIAAFPATRHADLWSGVGLACAYAGGAEQSAARFLRDEAGQYAPHLAQGAAFASKARQRAGNPAHHTESACLTLCGVSATEAALITDAALDGLSEGGGDVPAYEIWRRRIQDQFVKELVGA